MPIFFPCLLYKLRTTSVIPWLTWQYGTKPHQDEPWKNVTVPNISTWGKTNKQTNLSCYLPPCLCILSLHTKQIRSFLWGLTVS